MRLALVALLALACAPLAAQNPPSPVVTASAPPPQIVTSALGETRTVPDRAMIELSVQTRAATAAAAATQNAQKQRAVIAALRAQGLQAEQISTVNYNVYPDMRHDPRGVEEPKITGYVVTNSVRAELREVDKVGAVIDAALSAGANMISSLHFYSANTDAARRSALAAAVEKARGDAEALARAAGGSLGTLLELSTAEVGMPRPVYAPARMTLQAGAAADTQIEPGQQTVSVQVVARWSFLPGGR